MSTSTKKRAAGAATAREANGQKALGLEALARAVVRYHQKYERGVRTAFWDARQAGQYLLDAKEQIEHGEFMDWVANKTKLTQRTAQNYMTLARLGDEDAQRIAHLGVAGALTALAKTAEKKAPEPPAAFRKVDQDQQGEFCCPECKHEWRGDPRAGAK